MNIQETLGAFKARLDPLLTSYFDEKLEEARKKDPLVAEALEEVKKITLSGGKRLRPAFLYYGYVGAGGTDEERILKTSMAVELLHIYLLIHDDIIDRDDLRHGVPTLHTTYAQRGRETFPDKDSAHFGNSIAMIVGDMVAALANDILFRSGFPSERIIRALSKLQEVTARTVVGEAKDVYMEYKGEASEEEILSMYSDKTARYTIEGPLHVGALLAGGDEKLLELFSAYAVPLGIAFQIQDDILGVYGATERTGKPVGSDIEEGKLTLLVSHLFSNGKHDDKKEVDRILRLGTALTPKDIDQFRKIIENSGSLAYSQEEAARRIKAGKDALQTSTVPLKEESKDFLLSVADYLSNREY